MDMTVPDRPLEPPPGWADDEYPTPEDEEERFWEEVDRLWDEDHDF